MKLRKLSLLLMVPLLSCVQEIVGPDESFIKIYGKDADSQGFSVTELNDGRILILGQTGSGAFDPQLVTGGAQFSDALLNRAPSITIADQSGNTIDRKLYPLTGMDIDNNPLLKSPIDPNRAIFKSIIQLSNGKFLVAGEWMGLEPIQGIQQATVNVPFLVTLDQDFNFENLQDLNDNVTTDGLIRGGIFIKQDRDLNNYIFFNYFTRLDTINGQPDLSGLSPKGFSLVKLDNEGAPIWQNDYEYPNSTLNLGWDFTFSPENDVVVVGQDGVGQISGNTYMSRIDGITGLQKDSLVFIDNLYEAGITDPGTILPRDGGYALFSDVYPDIQILLFSETFGRRGGGIFTESGQSNNGQGQFIRHAYPTASGGYIVTTDILIEGDAIGKGEVFKLDSEGNVIWSYQYKGISQQAIELADGSVLILTNPRFNELTPKTTLIKLNPDGTL